ncbi:hypothetical protein EXIGLDRAFT_47004 [Exidia glandulosa HHB12029]|uniref:Uncharacterized protein n=1 Tax=Exidia glandulosa HHB12029 TaxID=1314781 RepID=A0A165P5C6_EXIGL|nr:hypothetical protein EXIGLDRAFT_47004 [Exidia glandulosa HHB12029]
MYPSHSTAGSNPMVQGSYSPGVTPARASSNQSLSQGAPYGLRPFGGATGIPDGVHYAVAYQHWRTHVAPRLGIEQVENELLPPAEFWIWFNAWLAHGPSSLGHYQAHPRTDAQAPAQAPAPDPVLNQSPVAALAQPPATAFGHSPDATCSTVRNPPLGPQPYAMTAALANPGAADGRSQSQAGPEAHVRRRSSILIDGPLTIVLKPGTRTGSGRIRGRK